MCGDGEKEAQEGEGRRRKEDQFYLFKEFSNKVIDFLTWAVLQP